MTSGNSGVKYSGRGVTGNNGNTSMNSRYVQYPAQYYGNGYREAPRYASGIRRHTSCQVEPINKDDLRYTAKYWAASSQETKAGENSSEVSHSFRGLLKGACWASHGEHYGS